MQFSPLMLSIAAPTAANAVQSIASFASGVGRSFAQTLNPAEPNNATPPASSETFSDRLHALANKLRSWLGEQGVTTPFEVSVTATSGTTQIESLGPDAERIAELIADSPELTQELQKLAATFQSLFSSMASSGAGLRITDQTAEASLL
jgi:hypothetical protein